MDIEKSAESVDPQEAAYPGSDQQGDAKGCHYHRSRRAAYSVGRENDGYNDGLRSCDDYGHLRDRHASISQLVVYVTSISIEERASVQLASEHRHHHIETEDSEKAETNHQIAAGTAASRRQDAVGQHRPNNVRPVVT